MYETQYRCNRSDIHNSVGDQYNIGLKGMITHRHESPALCDLFAILRSKQFHSSIMHVLKTYLILIFKIQFIKFGVKITFGFGLKPITLYV